MVIGENKPIVIFNAQFCGINEYKPILHPLSDLSKEITHKGYNDDQPFVPTEVINQLESSCGWSIHMPPSTLRPRRDTKENDLLHLWHFDTRNLIETSEAIDVNTLSFNPYSSQQ